MLGGQPLYLGLDLRGGVHFLMDVDMESAVEKSYFRYVDEIKARMRSEKIRYLGLVYENESLVAKFRDSETLAKAEKLISSEYSDYFVQKTNLDGKAPVIVLNLKPQAVAEAKKYALKQNITTLRNRINELGVAEPVIQQQGDRRIVVQLPGVQDTAKAKQILGATATLEFRLVEERGDALRAEKTGYAPHGSRLYNSLQMVAQFC